MNCLFYTHKLIFLAFLKGVYGKPVAILTWKNKRWRKIQMVEFVLIRCEQPECLNWTVILCGFEASGLVIFAVYIFQILSNTYITNYAHHLLILDRVWMLAWVKDCQSQKPLEKVCGLSSGFSQVFVTCAEDFSRTCLQECSCMK